MFYGWSQGECGGKYTFILYTILRSSQTEFHPRERLCHRQRVSSTSSYLAPVAVRAWFEISTYSPATWRAALPSVYLHPLLLIARAAKRLFLENFAFFLPIVENPRYTIFLPNHLLCSQPHTHSIDLTRPIKQCQRWEKSGTMSGERRRKAREWKLEWSCWINCCFIKDSLWWSKYDKMWMGLRHGRVGWDCI